MSHSRQGSAGGDLEAGVSAFGLKQRPLRASCELQREGSGCCTAGYCKLPGSSSKPAAAAPGAGSAAAAAVQAALAAASWRRAASVALTLALLLLVASQRRQLYRHCQDAAAALYYGLDPAMLGRSEDQHPAPRCCSGEGCAAGPGDRVAAVTYLRSDAYAPLLQQLECSLRRSNPGLELGLMMVPCELSEETLALARRLNITLLPVEPLAFPNTYDPRYGRNWLKVRALGLAQYHSVLLLDADVAVAGDLSPLFGLPAEFAAVWDQSKWLSRFGTVLTRINGGVFLLRPCAAAERHMLGLLRDRPKLRFTHSTAEQEFFGWYYRYTGWTLPLEWGAAADQSLDPATGLTEGGIRPRIVHFTGNKPFTGPSLGVAGHEYLCSLQELGQRAAGNQTASPDSQATASAGSPGRAAAAVLPTPPSQGEPAANLPQLAVSLLPAMPAADPAGTDG